MRYSNKDINKKKHQQTRITITVEWNNRLLVDYHITNAQANVYSFDNLAYNLPIHENSGLPINSPKVQ